MQAPQRRPSQPSWMRPLTERLSPVVKALVIANAVMFAFYAIVKDPQVRLFIDEHLALTPRVFRGEVWQLVTSLFVHTDPINFFFNLLWLWLIGAAVEQAAGRRRFLALFFVPAIVGNLVMVTVASLRMPQLFVGCGLAVTAISVAFGKGFGRTPVRVLGGLVVEARMLMAFYVGLSLLANVAQGALVYVLGELVAVGVAYLLAPGPAGETFFSRLRRGPKRPRAKLEVLEGGRGGRSEDRKPYLN